MYVISKLGSKQILSCINVVFIIVDQQFRRRSKLSGNTDITSNEGFKLRSWFWKLQKTLYYKKMQTNTADTTTIVVAKRLRKPWYHGLQFKTLLVALIREIEGKPVGLWDERFWTQFCPLLMISETCACAA